MNNTLIVVRRELSGYFATPVAYVFIVVFLALLGAMTFFVGNFFERGLADLASFFQFHPWLYILLIPAISMRLWAEERKSGTIEMFLTIFSYASLPTHTSQNRFICWVPKKFSMLFSIDSSLFRSILNVDV